jgi:hypothetical protein
MGLRERTHARATVPTSRTGLAEREAGKQARERGGGADKRDSPRGKRRRGRGGEMDRLGQKAVGRGFLGFFRFFFYSKFLIFFSFYFLF